MVTCAKINDLNISNVQATSRIKDKKLKDFAIKSLLLNNLPYNKKDKIFSSYLKQLNAYQFIILDEKFDYIEFEVLKGKIRKDSPCLYLCDGYFILFFKDDSYFLQKVDYEIEEKELINYINKKFDLKLDSLEKVAKEQMQSLKEEFEKNNSKSTLKNINEEKNNAFKIYLLYLVFILIFLVLYLKEISFSNQEIKTIQKQSNFHKGLENKIDKLLKKSNSHKVKLKLFKYENKNAKIVVSSKNKNDIYNFLLEYKDKISQENISCKENKKVYECSFYVKQF